jgi:arsenate reductase-like glutaredoxin family protein
MSGTGFGDVNARFRVYLAAPPAMEAYQQLSGMQPLQAGDIDQIYRHCGNGWRKIFNVYAKLLFALPPTHFDFTPSASSWQQFRDLQLLQAGSGTALCFSAPQFDKEDVFHLIAGRTLAKHLITQGLEADLHWLSSEFAVDPARKLLVTPFFDYRQLNNEKISVSAKLLQLLAEQVSEIERFLVCSSPVGSTSCC